MNNTQNLLNSRLNPLNDSLFYEIKASWRDFFILESEKKYFLNLINYINNLELKNIYFSPKIDLIFNLFKTIEKNNIQILIVGEAPYPNNDIANGIAFSTFNNIKAPGSLLNIKKEVKNCFSDCNIQNNDLYNWLKQGVLLLNVYWTYQKNAIIAKKMNDLWLQFTINFINYVKDRNTIVTFFGKKAEILLKYIDFRSNKYFCVVHPSPLSCYKGFINSKIFCKINKYAIKKVNWST